MTGPVATKNFGAEIDDATNQPGSGAALRGAFFKPPPPNGVGMQCAVIDKFSYGQVRVTRNRLTITLKDIERQASSTSPRATPAGRWCWTRSSAAAHPRGGTIRTIRSSPLRGVPRPSVLFVSR